MLMHTDVLMSAYGGQGPKDTLCLTRTRSSSQSHMQTDTYTTEAVAWPSHQEDKVRRVSCTSCLLYWVNNLACRHVMEDGTLNPIPNYTTSKLSIPGRYNGCRTFRESAELCVACRSIRKHFVCLGPLLWGAPFESVCVV